MRDGYLSAIRNFEGFTPQGAWDFNQVSNGYGTRAKFAGEIIDKAEAERRFQSEIADARKSVMRFAPDLDEGSVAALTSLTFNAGPTWMRSGLGAAIKSGDLDGARTIFKQYTKAGGKVLPGLVERRKVEAEWMGRGSIDTGSRKQAAAAHVTTNDAAVVAGAQSAESRLFDQRSSAAIDRSAPSVDSTPQVGAALGSIGIVSADRGAAVSPFRGWERSSYDIALLLAALSRRTASSSDDDNPNRQNNGRILQSKIA